MLLFLESTPDPASRGIARELRLKGNAVPNGATFDDHPVFRSGEAILATTDELHIRAEGIDGRLKAAGLEFDRIVFLSKHRSESARPTLTAHPVGNPAAAEFGGAPGRLGPTDGVLLTSALRALAVARGLHAYSAEVSFEATHHGPLLETPSIFLELGSSEKEWEDPAGHAVLADAALALLRPLPKFPVVVGLGGGHYGPRFTEAALTKSVHFAHMIPAHHAKAIDPLPLAAEAVRASPGASGVYYHDGTLPAPVRDAWLAAFRSQGLPSVRSRDWAPYAAPLGFR